VRAVCPPGPIAESWCNLVSAIAEGAVYELLFLMTGTKGSTIALA
jgi:hypothetical protein